MLAAAVGREAELGRVSARLGAARVCTVTGAAGVGKSLLARHLAAREETGTTWIDAETAPALVLALDGALRASATPVAPGETPQAALCSAVDGTRALVVVDGAERLADAVAAFVAHLLSSTDGSRVLVTSRIPLGLADEHVVRLGPLALDGRNRSAPGSDGPAVRLFRERYDAAGGPPVGDEHEPRLLEVVRGTGGLPLAIELSAARAALVGLAAAGPARGAPGATDVADAFLLDAVGRSLELLDEPEARLFRSLGATRGPVPPGLLAGLVGGDEGTAVRLAAGLVRHSLLEALPDGRFDLLPPLRRIAATLAGDEIDRAAAVAVGGQDEAAAGQPRGGEGQRGGHLVALVGHRDAARTPGFRCGVVGGDADPARGQGVGEGDQGPEDHPEGVAPVGQLAELVQRLGRQRQRPPGLALGRRYLVLGEPNDGGDLLLALSHGLGQHVAGDGGQLVGRGAAGIGHAGLRYRST